METPTKAEKKIEIAVLFEEGYDEIVLGLVSFYP